MWAPVHRHATYVPGLVLNTRWLDLAAVSGDYGVGGEISPLLTSLDRIPKAIRFEMMAAPESVAVR